MTTRRVEVSIEERTGCGAGRRGSGFRSGDPRPAAVSPDPEDPRPAAVSPDPEDPRPAAVSPDPEDPGEGARTVTIRTRAREAPGEVWAADLDAGDYSGFLIVRVSDRCSGSDGSEVAPASGDEAPSEARGTPELAEEGVPRELPEEEENTPGEPVCRRVRERIEQEARLLECLEPDVVVGRPLCLGALAELVRENPPRPLIRSVAPETLRELERRASRTWLPPLHSLTAYCRIDACHLPLRVARELVALLNELPWVDLAYLELAATDPQGPTPDVFTLASRQFYLDDAPVGLGVRRLRREGLPGGDGAGVRIVDLEQGWFLAHEDFRAPVPPPFYGANRPDTDPGYRGDHGTAVLGELAAVADDERGVDGLAPAADLRVLSHYDAETRSNGHVADAVVAAVAVLARQPLARGGPAPDPPFAPGDVLLLEVQRGRLPAEVDHADFDALRLASALGLVVVEAAGNGGFDLDRYRDETGRRILARSDGTAQGFRESGAVVAGAARSDLPHDRSAFSCFGSRVDCYAWGDGVVTTGYGDLGGDEERDAYTRTFAGTSSAAPMVAGVAAVVQGLAGAGDPADRLVPRELLRALADPAAGTPQGPGRGGRIGTMPDLPALVRSLGLVPDVRLDDREGAPDLLAFGAGVAPAVGMAAGGVSVRLANRGRGAARGVRVTVFAAELATLVPPERWRRLGTSAPLDVPQGGRPLEAGPVPLPPEAPDPASYLCVTHRDEEPPPLPPGDPYFRFDDYLAFMRRHGHQSLAEAPAPPAGETAELRFSIAGTADRPRHFDFELHQILPEPARVRLSVPRALAGGLAGGSLRAAEEEVRTMTVDGTQRRVTVVPFPLPARPRLTLPRLRLGAAAYPCWLAVEGLDQNEGATLFLRQLHRGEEVGGVAWRIG